ncbi:MAG: 3-dehydroquinate synthase [Gammaproteobacteria bacterium]
MNAQVNVQLGERSYPIYIGSGLLDGAALLVPHIRGRQVFVVTDAGVAPHYLDALVGGLGDYEVRSLTLPNGESAKTLDTVSTIFDALLEYRFNRRATILALGGGVVGDMAGFAAACYQRGVAYLQIPTTLLSQVDSSVGGKTAVNHPRGKNMIGAFYQPVAVVADVGTLSTLSDREFLAGLAEVIKYGVMWDGEFFEWLEKNLDALIARSPTVLSQAVKRSCEIKAEVVQADEREDNIRALLNLGHTFGHAIETGVGYGTWLHGEAVAAGMCMAADTATRIDWMRGQDKGRVEALIARAGLPTRAPLDLSPETMLDLMKVDKKALDGGIQLVLPRGIGTAQLTGNFDSDALRETLTQCRG